MVIPTSSQATAAPVATTPATTAVPRANTALTAAPSTSAPAAAGAHGTLNIGFKELFPFGNGPRLVEANVMVFVGTTSGETLLKMTIDREIIPQMVTDWSLDESGSVWTLKLREGIDFHGDWGEMTAADVVYTMEEYAAPDSVNALQGVMQ